MIQHITIQYSIDSGSNWHTIEEQYSVDSGSYNWTAPETESVEYLIRIYDSGAFADGYDLGDAYDVSDFVFNVFPPQSASLEYSTDSGSTWHLIDMVGIESGSETGSYSWIAPSTTSAQYLVRISSASVSDESDATFTIFQPFAISGSVFPASLSETVSDVTISLSGVENVAYTNALGYYELLIYSQSYTGILSASKLNHTFSPVTYSYSDLSSSLDGQDFIITYVPPPTITYFISGSITVSGSSTPISGATITFEVDPIITQVFSNINGNYSASFTQNSYVTFYASHPLYQNVSPTASIITDLTSDQYGQNFTAELIMYTISGSILSSSGDPLPGIEILCDMCTASLFTDANGNYSRSYATGSNVLLTPTSTTYSFIPSNREYNLLSASVNNENYIGVTLLPAHPGLGAYYDSRKSYDSGTNVWEELTGYGIDITTYNTYYNDTKNIYFGTPWLGPATSSIDGILISSSFAIEMWTAPYKSVSENLITNPQFSGSLGFTGWQTNSMALTQSVPPPADSDFPAASSGIIISTTTVPVAQFNSEDGASLIWVHTGSKVNYPYKFTFYGKLPTTTGKINCSITQNSGSGITVLQSSSFDIDTSWQRQETTFTSVNQSDIIISMSLGTKTWDELSKLMVDNFTLREYVPIRTLFATRDGVYPYLFAYVSSSVLKFEYAPNIVSTVTQVTSSVIVNEEKFNHLVFYVSKSKISTWANGQYFSSASVSGLDWGGPILGALPSLYLPYHGYLDVIKIWNDVNIDRNEINTYYQNKNYFANLQNVVFLDAEPGSPIIYTGNDSVISYIIAASGPSSPPMSGSEVTIYISSSII